MKIDRDKFLMLAVTMSLARQAGCVVYEDREYEEVQVQQDPSTGGEVYGTTTTTTTTTGYQGEVAPADECVQWDENGQCLAWESQQVAPADECTQWDPTGECIGWAPMQPVYEG